MTDETTTTKCQACGAPLTDYDDFVFRQSIRFALGSIPWAAAICAAWAPLFFLARLLVGGGISHVAFSALLVLLVKKAAVGAIIGVLLGIAVGIGRTEIGLLLGAVIGSIGGFFIVATDALPLVSDASHRIDVVLSSIIPGIICTAIVHFAAARVRRKKNEWLGPEPKVAE